MLKINSIKHNELNLFGDFKIFKLNLAENVLRV